MSEKQQSNTSASIIFVCDKELRDEFWKICAQNNVNPHSLLRGFMRRAVKDWKDKSNSNPNPNPNENE